MAEFKHPQVVLNYFQRVGAEVLNFRRAMIKQYRDKYYVERALIKISADGTVTCSRKEFAPTPGEAAAMEAALAGVEWPKIIQARNIDDLKRLTHGVLYEFIDRTNTTDPIIMVQERREPKRFLPWVLLSTGEWISMEPDGALPFWRARKGLGHGSPVMIHEGAKAAQAAEKIARNGKSDHPWAEELARYEHWGMIGGALAPHRTDFDVLHRHAPDEVVYVCDNDEPGTSALQKVSLHWGRSLKGIVFGFQWPPGWDMAEDLPPYMFGKKQRWIGPRLSKLMRPATHATELVPPAEGQGRPKAVLRDDFIREWRHCIRPEVYMNLGWPHVLYTAEEFNNAVAPFTHARDVALLLQKHDQSKTVDLEYVPSLPPGLYTAGKSGTYLNTYAPSDVKAEAGDPTPWLNFLEHLVPDDNDRVEVMRWIATLVARPDLRPHYGMLMISTQQGVGKGTLGEKILAPLVGENNVSFPSEEQVVDSQFDYWSGHKRLAVMHEIYAGHSSKAYNKLKSKITDKGVEVNQKYRAHYTIQCHVMVFACSNSERALQLAVDDRRWFVPQITDEKQPLRYWEGLHDWLNSCGGLQIIRWWCDEWLKTNEPAYTGTHAPASVTKQAIIEEGYSPGMRIVQQALETMRDKRDGSGRPVFTLDYDLVDLIRERLYEGRQNDKLERPATVRTVAKNLGMHIGTVRAQIRDWGTRTYGAKVLSFDEKTANKSPGELFNSTPNRMPFTDWEL